MDLIRTDGICFSYASTPVLRDVSLTVKKGQVVSLLGPNGSGKSTLIKILLGIHKPSKGSVLFEGKPVAEIPPRELARQVAYVPQTHRMAFAYSVLDVVLMGRTPHKPFFSRTSKHDVEIALQALERLSIAHLKDRSYTEVSGGERQLALIARALTQGARTLVMDEPANGLDFGNQIRLLDRIQGLADSGYTFVKSTHFPDHALWVADHVILLRKGTVVADGSPGTIMSEEAIGSLYNTEIRVLEINDRLKTCLPRSIVENGHKTADRARWSVDDLRRGMSRTG